MHYYLIGICGVSMSGVAKLLATQGHRVTGSDLNHCQIVVVTQNSKLKTQNYNSKVKTEEIKIYEGHSEKNITKDIDEVIYTVAAEDEKSPGFIELKKARELGIKTTKRSKFIGRMMNNKIGISITGMHGKTTVTTMVSLILEKAGYNPTCLVGSKVKEWGSNVRIGGKNEQGNIVRAESFENTRNKLREVENSQKELLHRTAFESKDKGLKFGKLNEYFVTETDESAKQLLDFRPKIAVISNLDREHLDTYEGGMLEIQQTFKKFIRLLPPNGLLVVWQEDKNLMPLTKAAKCKVKRVSIDKPWPGLKLKVPGKHNLLDATLAARVCHELGVDNKTIKKVLNGFTGAARRFEIKGEKNDVLVIDDYGHNPTEIKSVIAGVREFMNKFQISDFRFQNMDQSKIKNQKSRIKNRLIMVFQPHQQQRTKLLFDDFIKCFNGVDELIITDVYLIAGREKDIGENLAKKLVEEIKKRNINVKYIESSNNYQKITDYLKENTKKGNLVITQGATDIYKVGDDFLV